jgi:cold shock protein
MEVAFMTTGLVKWFNQVSGYGFIAPDEAGPDQYVRRENIIGAPSTVLADVRVRFDSREGGMGPEAINVRLLGR